MTDSSYCDGISVRDNSDFETTLEASGQEDIALINHAELRSLNLLNAYQTNITFANLNFDYGGNTVSGKTEAYTEGVNTRLVYKFSKSFNGDPGFGQAGAQVIPDMFVPSGFYISEVMVYSNTVVGSGPGVYIGLGIDTDDAESGLDSTSGDIATLASPVIQRITDLPYSVATALRKMVMSVNVDDITGGAMSFEVTLKKFV